MKKRVLISAALVVLLLEIGFGVYVAFERKYESGLNAISLPVDAVKQIQTDTDIEMAKTFRDDDLLPEAEVKPAARKFNVRNIDAKHIVSKTTASAEKRIIKPVFQKAATTNKQLVAAKMSESAEIPVTEIETPRSENRSLIARTLPIVKKPFGWIKALGSKLR